MKNLMKMGAYLLLVVTFAYSITGCHKDDNENVTPPTVTVTNKVIGRVTNMSGDGITATVTMNGTETKQTASDGTFEFENVSAGTYTMKADASGKISKEESITVPESENGQSLLWDVTLSSVGTSVAVNADGSAAAVVSSETTKGNETGKVDMNMIAPAGAIPAGSTLVITPVYSLEDGASVSKTKSAVVNETALQKALFGGDISTRASSETVVLIGTNLSCSNTSATLQKTIKFVYTIDAEVAKNITVKKYVNGQWVDATFTVDGETITVTVDTFTSYSLLFQATVSTSTSSENITFSQSSWDNLYGSSSMMVESATYTYKIGTSITSSGTDKVTAYLIEILAHMAGMSATTATGTYPINVTLPVGTALNISGKQAVDILTISSLNKSVSSKKYGAVTVVTQTYNRNHTGGSGGSTL